MQQHKQRQVNGKPVLPLLGQHQVVELFKHRLAPGPQEIGVLDALELRRHDLGHRDAAKVLAFWVVDGVSVEGFRTADEDRVAG